MRGFEVRRCRAGLQRRRRGAPVGARTLTCCVLLLSLAGCSSTRFHRVDPSRPIQLAPGEALLAFHVDSELPLRRIVFTGLVIRQSLSAGRHFWIARLPAGDYSWHSLHVGIGPYEGGYELDRDRFVRPGELDFTIVPGKLNYVG